MTKKLLLSCCTLFFSGVSSISATPYTAGIRANSLGLQLELGYQLSNNLGTRIQGGGFYHYKKNFTFEDIDYQDVCIRPLNLNALLDWYFLQTGRDYGLRLTAGVGYNANIFRLNKDLSVTGNSLGNNNTYYNGAQIGIFKAKYRFRRITPMVMVGYDSAPLGKSNLFLSIDVGAYFQGKAKARATGTGDNAGLANFARDAKEEAENLVNKHRWIKTFPIVSVAIKYQF